MTTTTATPQTPASAPGMPPEVVTRTPVQDVTLPGGAGILALVTLDNGLDHTRPTTFGPQSVAALQQTLDGLRARAEAGIQGAASDRDADDLIRDVAMFLRLVERMLVLQPVLPQPHGDGGDAMGARDPVDVRLRRVGAQGSGGEAPGDDGGPPARAKPRGGREGAAGGRTPRAQRP